MTEVIAHRGLRSEWPENTAEGINATLGLPKISGVEFDGELTKDGKLVVLHQETVVADADFRKVELATRNFTSRDWVVERTAAEVSTLDAGSWFDARFSDLRVPSLPAVFCLDWKDVTAYVELKDATYWGTRDLSRPGKMVAAALPDLLAFSGKLNTISFNPEILVEMRNQAEHIPRTLAIWTDMQERQADVFDAALRSGAGTISLADVMVLEDPKWVTRAHDHGMAVHVYPVSPARGEPEYATWTAHSQFEKWGQLVDLGVDGLVSDFARETLQFLETRHNR